jgi:transmembrane sensor
MWLTTLLKKSQDEETPALEREAHGWVRKLTSGGATPADAAAFRAWRDQSQDHAAAFAKAMALWDHMGSAGRQWLPETSSISSLLDREAKRQTTRRALLGSGLAAAAVGAGVAVVRPPLGLWPSWSEIAADWRTEKGEQRQVDLAGDYSIAMNTRTSIALRPDTADAKRIELLSGEASIEARQTAPRPITVIASNGQSTGAQARFDVRYIADEVRVTCLSGEVSVGHSGRTVVVREKQQVAYDERRLGDILAIDPAVETAWQDRLLIFRYTPLPAVIEELNRYRPGRIFVVNAALNRHVINGRFRLDRLDDVLIQLHQAFGVEARSLPGGIVLLS